MTNSSIFAAFERMWQHIVSAIGNALSSAKTYTDDAVAQKTQVQIITWDEELDEPSSGEGIAPEAPTIPNTEGGE